MSMKRSRHAAQGSRYREDSGDSWFAAPKPAEVEKSWGEQIDGQADDVFVPYALAGHFPQGALLAHSVFGKGVVVAVDGRRIDVLFESGHKKLSHAG